MQRRVEGCPVRGCFTGALGRVTHREKMTQRREVMQLQRCRVNKRPGRGNLIGAPRRGAPRQRQFDSGAEKGDDQGDGDAAADAAA